MSKAANGLIYGFTSYLDAMSSGWDGLVLNDYAAVFPLPWRKKWGTYYLFQPFLTAQLGAFGNHISEEIMNAFFRSIPRKFKYLDLPLNPGNIFPEKFFPTLLRKNYTLNLSTSYENIYQNYHQNSKRNIKKASKAGCTVIQNVPIEKIISLAQPPVTNKKDISSFKRLYNNLHSNHQAITYGVLGPNQELLASCVFFYSSNRAYYILVGNHPDGRNTGASHLLIDSFIKNHAGKNLTLDFEGSDIEGIAFFYRGFGAAEETYPVLRYNRLPWWCRWLKR